MERFAVVDLETTGGSAERHQIIEIGILFIEDGAIVETYQQLVQPDYYIPQHITSLTGITNADVRTMPFFQDLAAALFHKLEQFVFVAHNVNFDYSFLKASFERAGYKYDPPRLCTVRYAKAVVPGLSSYGLSNLTNIWNLHNAARHRALGDAEVTAHIFLDLLRRDADRSHYKKLVKGAKKKFQLPLGMEMETIQNLPEATGVYYLLDRAGKVLYVGKSTNIKQRIITHFSGDLERSKTQHWLRDVAAIKTRLCGHELAALVWEDLEIHHLWPKFNKAQKVNRMDVGLFKYQDRVGNTRLKVARVEKGQVPMFRFASHLMATAWLREQIDAFGLFPAYCGMFPIGPVNPETHEEGILKLEAAIAQQQEGFVILLDGPSPETQIFLWMVGGHFYAMGAAPAGENLDAKSLSRHIWRKATSHYCDRIIWQHLTTFPDTKIEMVRLEADVFLGTQGLNLFS